MDTPQPCARKTKQESSVSALPLVPEVLVQRTEVTFVSQLVLFTETLPVITAEGSRQAVVITQPLFVCRVDASCVWVCTPSMISARTAHQRVSKRARAPCARVCLRAYQSRH